jgi:hypothetical protein
MTDDEKMDALLRQMAAEEYNRPPHIVPREQMWEAIQSGLGTGEAGSAKREADLGGSKVVPITRGSRIPRWIYFAVAAVALLAVGIQLGRMMGRSSDMAEGPKTLRDSAAVKDSTLRGLPNDAAPVTPDQRLADGTPRSDDGKGKPRPRPEPERFSPTSPNDASVTAYTVATAQHLTEAEAMLTAFKGDLNQGRMDAQISVWGKDLLSNTRLLLDSPAAQDPVRRRLLQDLELVLVQIVQLSPNASARDRDLIKGALTDDQVLTRLRTAIPVQKGT